MSELPHNLVKANQVIGVDVINNEGENIGKVEEIVLDKISGQTEYAVLSFGGILGLDFNKKLFALPWRTLSYNKDEDAFVVPKSKKVLENAPGFDKENWPDMAQPAWRNDIDTFYAG